MIQAARRIGLLSTEDKRNEKTDSIYSGLCVDAFDNRTGLCRRSVMEQAAEGFLLS